METGEIDKIRSEILYSIEINVESLRIFEEGDFKKTRLRWQKTPTKK